MPIKILVNAIPLTNIHTGIARYISCLYSTMERMFSNDIEVTYFDGKNFSPSPPKPPQNLARWGSVADNFWKLPPQVACMIREAVQLKRELRLAKKITEFDLYHETGFFPFACAKRIPTVFTIHDMSIQRHPQWHPQERVLFIEKNFTKRCSSADHILSVSKFTRSEFYSIYPELSYLPVTPIHLAGFLCDNSIKDAPFNLPKRYFLFVGSNDKRKQLENAIEAIKELNTYPLVIAGWNGWGNKLQQHEKIIPLGYISDSQLSYLYKHAEYLLYPSAYEGFGLPVVEAMQYGCPVITTRCASLPEVGGEAAYYIESPPSVKNILTALKKANTESKPTSKSKRISHAQTFSWEKTAQATYNIFIETIEKKSRKQ